MSSPLVYLTVVIVLGVAAQWLAAALRLPAILLLLAAGFLAGQWVNPETVIRRETLFAIVSLSVALILFEGGLTLRVRDLGDSRPAVFRLVTIGLLVTWVLAGLAATMVFDNVRLAILAGAIYTVTGPTVIGPLLRQIRPKKRIGSVARWEGIVNDPIGAVLAVLVFESIVVERSGGLQTALAAAGVGLLRTVVVGGGLGLGAAGLIVTLLRRRWIPEYLENPVLLATVVGAFTASNLLQPESGLATVTIMGVVLANQKRAKIAHVVEFKESLGVLLLAMLFILLASRLEVSDLTSLGWSGVAFVLLLILVVRPVAVFVATIGSRLTWQERLFLGWLAPRGIVAAAVTSIFALELAERANLDPADADRLVPLTFLVIVGTVLVYGLTSNPLARRLQISDPSPQGILFAGANRLAIALAKAVRDEGHAVLLVDTSHDHVAAARMEGLPAQTASILSDYVREELDLAGIGRLLAMTPNDQVNALAALQFVEVFGKAGVYQLAPHQSSSTRRETTADSHLRGRYLFRDDATSDQLESLLDKGYQLKKTRLTEEFNFEAFKSRYSDAVLMFYMTATRDVHIVTAEKSVTPKPGYLIVSLVPQESQAPK